MQWNKRYWKVNLKLAKKRVSQTKFNAKYFVFALVACASFFGYNEYQKYIHSKNLSTFSAWQTDQVNMNSRSPAGKEVFTCSYNDVNAEQIKQEIKALEKKYQTGSIIQGKFYGLDLSILPSIGAQLLADNKALIGDKNKNLDFSQCKNVTCVFNQIYNDKNGLSGYYVYYWYLKTGSMISLTNFIPGQESINAGEYSGNKFNHRDFLFSQNDLKRLYFLAKSLPEKLKFIPLLKSIHKIPGRSSIEGQNQNLCSTSLPNGHILLTQKCLSSSNKQLFLNIAKEIAKYADRHEGLKKGQPDLSTSKEWLFASDWYKENHFNINSHTYQYRWKTGLPNNQFVNAESRRSPSEQLASLIASYRYDSEQFKAKTSLDLRAWIKNEVFSGTSYDAEGLYKQYINQALDTWARQEVTLWKSCLDNHLKEKNVEELQRDLANSLEHPLYSCVENKIPNFVNFIKTKVQKDYFEGCQFFNDDSMYGHMATKFDNNVEKYLFEKILQRKIEIQKHGPEVLIGQDIKSEFVTTVDPKSYYIDCYAKSNTKNCYEHKVKGKVEFLINKHPKVKNYYREIIKEDILALYPFHYVKRKSNEAAKLFLAPYANRIYQAANKMWNSCKDQGIDHTVSLKLPMKFSGGRYFVNPKLINCINKKVDNELIELAGLSAFQHVNGERKEYRLTKKERDFALSFVEGKLLQTLNNLLDEEFHSEKVRFAQYFREIRNETMSKFSEDSDIMQNVFSVGQSQEVCINKVSKFYPKNYYYHSKSSMDNKYGAEICKKFVSLPDIRRKLAKEINRQWMINKSLAIGFLAENYQEMADDCFSDYPVTQRGRNKSYRDICIKQSFDEATLRALMEWKSHKHFKYFENKENQIISHFNNKLRHKFISRASQQEPLVDPAQERNPAGL